MKKEVNKIHTFRKRRYTVYLGQLKGITDVSTGPPGLYIRTDGISERQILITLFHEILHASNPKLSERVVERMAVEGGGLLWKLGYRRIEG